MRSRQSRCILSVKGTRYLLSAGIFSLVAVGIVVAQDANGSDEKLRRALQTMQGSWEQNTSQSKSWGMDCAGTIKITRILSLNEIDEARHVVSGSYTREATGRMETSNAIARGLGAGRYGRPEFCVFADYNESTFFENRTYDVTITCSAIGDNCWLHAKETGCSGTCITHERTLTSPVDGGRAFLSVGGWYFSRRYTHCPNVPM